MCYDLYYMEMVCWTHYSVKRGCGEKDGWIWFCAMDKNQRTITMASNSCRMENKSNAIECVAIEFFTSLVDHLAYSILLNVLHIPKSFMQSGGEKNLVLHFHAPTHSMHTCMHAYNTPARLLAL